MASPDWRSAFPRPISVVDISHHDSSTCCSYPASRTHLVAATTATVKKRKRAEIDIIADHQTIKCYTYPFRLEGRSANVGLAQRSPPSGSLTASRTLSHHKPHHIFTSRHNPHLARAELVVLSADGADSQLAVLRRLPRLQPQPPTKDSPLQARRGALNGPVGTDSSRGEVNFPSAHGARLLLPWSSVATHQALDPADHVLFAHERKELDLV